MLGLIIAVRATPAMRTSAAFTVARRLFGPMVGEAVSFLDRVISGSAPVRRRLRGLGGQTTPEEFRLEQVVLVKPQLLGDLGSGLYNARLREEPCAPDRSIFAP